jgi:hypothetical protein
MDLRYTEILCLPLAILRAITFRPPLVDLLHKQRSNNHINRVLDKLKPFPS